MKFNKKILIPIFTSAFVTGSVSLIFFGKNIKDLKELSKSQTKELDELAKTTDDIVTRLDEIDERIDKIEMELNDETTKDLVKENKLDAKEKIVLEYFQTTKQDVSNIFNRENIETYKESVVQAFIYLTDFIFFDGELEGIKFKDLTTETKATAVTFYVEIDKLISNLYPNYKENLNSKYDTVKEFFQELYDSNLSEEGKENIENILNEVSDVVETTGNFTNDVYDGAKTKVKTWYENLKANH